MNKINSDKASDIVGIKPAVIKDLTSFIAPTLTTLFNRAIDEHQYPDALKITKVIELYKKKDPTFPKNYRPISLLPILAKLLDTVINNQIMDHVIEHDIISPTQYAFRPNSSTTTAPQTVINRVYKHSKQTPHTRNIHRYPRHTTQSHTRHSSTNSSTTLTSPPPPYVFSNHTSATALSQHTHSMHNHKHKSSPTAYHKVAHYQPRSSFYTSTT